MKKKIMWITSDCFVDVDFNVEVLSHILKTYTIDWYILLPKENAIYSNYDFSLLEKLEGLSIFKLESSYKSGDFRKITLYTSLLRFVKTNNPDVIYVNCAPSPFIVLFSLLLNKNKTIIATHEGFIHSGFNHRKIRILMRKLLFWRVKTINLFSKSQANLFLKSYPRKRIFVTPLALKSFGNSLITKNDDCVVFLVFGHLCYEKNIELLIQAANNIYNKVTKNFKIVIKGNTLNWEFYKNQIKYPEIFECDIRLIDNSEIPDIFCSSHFLVQPYRIVSQSGPLKIAFNYNLPVICTNLPGFSDEVTNGINGFLFENDNTESLEDILIKCINLSQDEYSKLLSNMKIHTNKNYSPLSLGEQYISMFDSVTVE